jgi:hypothetical protein
MMLAAGGIILIWVLQVPIPLATDEVSYLLAPCEHTWAIPVQWGPGYKAFYCGISALTPSPIAALFVKSALVAALTSLVLFGIALALRVRPALAALVSLSITMTMLTISGTSEFAFLLASAACLCVLAAPRPAGWYGFIVLATASFLARPEYLLVLLGGLGILFWQNTAAWRRGVALKQINLLPLLVGTILFAFCIGYTIVGPQTSIDRTWVAFGQHFALNIKEADDPVGDPWVEWETFVASAFPTSHSVAEAMRENPAMFGWHLSYNILHRLPEELYERVLPPLDYGPHWLDARVPHSVLFGIVLLVAGAGFWSWQWHSKDLRARLLILLPLLPIPLVSLLVMPRARHLLPLLPLLIVFVGWGIEQMWSSRWHILKALPVALALALTFSTASFLSMATAALANPQPSIPDLIEDIQEHTASGQRLRILSAAHLGTRLCNLAEADAALCQGISLEQGVVPSRFAEEEGATWIVIDPMLRDNSAVQHDPVMQTLLNEAPQCGCSARPTLRGDYQVIRCSPTFSGCSE